MRTNRKGGDDGQNNDDDDENGNDVESRATETSRGKRSVTMRQATEYITLLKLTGYDSEAANIYM